MGELGGLANRLRGGGVVCSDALAPPSLARIRKAARESPIAALLWQSNVSGKDIPDAAAYLRNHAPSPQAPGNLLAIPTSVRAIRYAFWQDILYNIHF